MVGAGADAGQQVVVPTLVPVPEVDGAGADRPVPGGEPGENPGGGRVLGPDGPGGEGEPDPEQTPVDFGTDIDLTGTVVGLVPKTDGFPRG